MIFHGKAKTKTRVAAEEEYQVHENLPVSSWKSGQSSIPVFIGCSATL